MARGRAWVPSSRTSRFGYVTGVQTCALPISTKAAPRLLCLWYDAQCEEAAQHSEELARFRGHIDGEVDVKFITYQQAFEHLTRSAEPVPGYLDYLATRYFAV